MSVNVEMRKNPSMLNTRFFLIHGLPPVQQAIEINVGTNRKNASTEALESGFPMGAFLLSWPYFSQIKARNIKGIPCIEISLASNVEWDKIITTGSLEDVTRSNIEKKLENAPTLVASNRISGLFNFSGFEDEVRKFIESHHLQQKAELDNGSLAFRSYDPVTREIAISPQGNCSSSTTCTSSDITISQNILRTDLILNFPGYITKVTFPDLARN